VVVHAPADRRLPEFFIETAHPDAATIGAVHRSLVDEGYDPGAWRRVIARDPLVRALPDRAGDAVRELLRDAGVIEGGVALPEAAHRLRDVNTRVARHRRAAQARFQRFMDYLAGRQCRHLDVVTYFGEQAAAVACGDRCDVCTGAGTAVTGPLLDATPIRQALSAAARLRGRVGMVKLARVLVGSQSREIAGASSIPTFGALRGWREADVVELLRRLADAGALRVAGVPYPTVDLTRRGVEAMRGDLTLEVADPRPGSRPPARDSAAASETLDAEAQALFARLCRWRTETARQRRYSAFVVFPDRTLVEIARRRPTTPDELLAVPGVGEGKKAMYGDAVLAMVAASAEAP
jgi:ATP-dependent DNA helicase RecQ